jgi:hypothetical protein
MTMLWRVFSVSLFTLSAHAFCPIRHPTGPHHVLSATKASPPKNFFEDWLRPVHGFGSGRKQLDQIFDAEQNVLKDRKAHYQKMQLKDKYAPSYSWISKLLNPFHMHGSGETKLNDMYQAQQKILYERREYYGNKKMLHDKYRTHKDHLRDIKVHPFDPAVLNKKEDDAMYT